MEFASQWILRRHRGPVGLFLLFHLIIISAGCGHVSPAPTGRTSDEPGTAGIVTASFLPEVRLDLPGKGRVDGAVRGAGRGFLAGAEIPLRILGEGMSGCSTKECGYLAIGILALATASGTVGAVVGGVHGAVHAMPLREARRMEKATQALANLRIQEILTDRLLEAGTDSISCRYIPLPDAFWATPDDVVDHVSRAGEGFDSILEIGVTSVGFRGTQWGRDPPLSVFLTVRVRRYGGKDGKLLGVENLVYESDESKFVDWMADGASLAEEEFELGYRVIAGRIIAGIPCR